MQQGRASGQSGQERRERGEEGRMGGGSHQNGLRTERHGCLQVTGSNCSKGVSGFSFKGV